MKNPIAMLSAAVAALRPKAEEPAPAPKVVIPRQLRPPVRKCQHQASPIPCAYPSCPAGVSGERLRLVVVRRDGTKVRMQFRRRMSVRSEAVHFDWTPA